MRASKFDYQGRSHDVDAPSHDRDFDFKNEICKYPNEKLDFDTKNITIGIGEASAIYSVLTTYREPFPHVILATTAIDSKRILSTNELQNITMCVTVRKAIKLARRPYYIFI